MDRNSCIYIYLLVHILLLKHISIEYIYTAIEQLVIIEWGFDNSLELLFTMYERLLEKEESKSNLYESSVPRRASLVSSSNRVYDSVQR